MPDDDAFTTKRLRALEWHAAERRGLIDDLPQVVASMLTEPVTHWLPGSWHGTFTRERAAEWIEQQDAEGRVLLVATRESAEPLGLVLLFEEPVDGGVDVRLGYLLAEDAWGRGYGGELLEGLVAWCRARGDVRSIIGGVVAENTASIRLLQRHGFVVEPGATDDADITYRLRLDGRYSGRARDGSE